MAQVLELEGLVPADEARAMAAELADAPFADGRATASGRARAVKHNEQLAEDHPLSKKHAHRLFVALSSSAPFRAAAVPHTLLPLRFCRYRPGMAYGDHLDAPLLSTASSLLRTDLSLTIWLSDPADYDGGELVMRRDDGTERAFKGAAGDATLYSSNTLHRVEPVTRGQRLVAISWLQSAIPDDTRRALLFELTQIATRLQTAAPDEMAALHHLHQRLTRMWSQC